MLESICRRLVAPFLLAGLLPGGAAAAPLLSELFYDASGSDDGLSFVELWGAPGTPVDGLRIEGVNGSNGSITHSLALEGAIGSDGLFVVADAAGGGSSLVPNADLVLDFDFQNGPDSVVLRGAGGSVLDALGYGEFGPGEVFAGEGRAAPDAPADSALARVFADVDSDDNFADFQVAPPSPGSAPIASVPEPAGALLLGAGLLVLQRLGRSRR